MDTHHRIQLLERRVKVCFIVTLRAQGGATDNLRVRQITVVDAKGTERIWIGAPVPDPIVQGRRVPRNGAVSGMILLVLEEKAQAVFQQPPATR